MKKTRQLVASLVAIVICFAMLLGTTYAWFTDSIVNTNNIIKSGNVDVELTHTNAHVSDEVVKEDTKLFVNTAGNEILWEPGASTKETFVVSNVGSLAFKYELRIKAVSKTFNENNESLENVLALTAVGDENEKFDVLLSGTLEKGESKTFEATISWTATANDNDFMNLKLLLGVELVATQLNFEYDGTGNGFDETAEFPNVSSSVDFSQNLQEDGSAIIETKGENSVSMTLPASVVEALQEAGYSSASLAHTDVVESNGKFMIESMEVVDKDGKIIDLAALNLAENVTISLPAQNVIAEGSTTEVYHDGELVAENVTVGANGVITYEVAHLCEVMVKEVGAKVKTQEELVAALEAGKNVTLADNITLAETLIIPANLNVTLDLNGKELIAASNGYVLYNENGSTLTILDNSTAANGVVSGVVYTGAESTTIIENGTYNAVEGGKYVFLNEGGSLTINDGMVNGGSSYPIYSYGAGAKLVINDVTCNATFGCINAYTADTTVEINGGEFYMTGVAGKTSHIAYFSNVDVVINGGTFKKIGDVNMSGTGGGGICAIYGVKLTINGGEFAGDYADIYNWGGTNANGRAVEISIAGGSYKFEPTASFLAEGYKAEKDGEIYIVKQA